jgi:outer membrane translocation and assembly module TamA
METLGGAETIRGFDEFRFRDRRNFLIQAEYRWEIWAFVDMTVFVDTGKVFSDLDDFNFEDLHTGYGFGLRVHTPGGFRLRFDVAHSVEGFKLHISSGPSF